MNILNNKDKNGSGVLSSVSFKNVSERFTLYSVASGSQAGSFKNDILNGLLSFPKSISPKNFYDEKGSALFEKICSTSEYYVTRTEASIIKEHSKDIAGKNRTKNLIVELGSGSSVKTHNILQAFLNSGCITYVPVDVSEIIVETGQRLADKFNGLVVKGILGEYEPSLLLAAELFSEPKLVMFLGSSIGNFDLQNAGEFLHAVAGSMHTGDSLLIGFDMVKDLDILNAAYNDSEGITAAFNLNLLNRINSELDADFDLNNFDHKAFFNESESRIEMHLVSKCDQKVNIAGIEIPFKKGETIHTENSYKFTDNMIISLAQNAGFSVLDKWSDAKNWFSLYLFTI